LNDTDHAGGTGDTGDTADSGISGTGDTPGAAAGTGGHRPPDRRTTASATGTAGTASTTGTAGTASTTGTAGTASTASTTGTAGTASTASRSGVWESRAPESAGPAVIVTGGSRGLGRETTLRLAAQGCDLAVCGRDATSLEAVAEEVRARYGRTLHTARLDVLDESALAAFVRESAARLGRVDGLVTVAGGARGADLRGTEASDWDLTCRLNVTHPAIALREAADHLAGTGGSAVLVSSVSGWKPAPPAQYAAAKAAQIHMASSLARELGPRGVRVNCVSPGSMLIEGKGWARLRDEDPRAYREFEKEFPGGRLVDPRDVAEVIAFLLSDGARAVNGANVPVDDGQNAPSAYGY
jgi:3-oxoacyl-[acyl-carrier protein] reductase